MHHEATAHARSARARTRLPADGGGFTLIELLVTLVIVVTATSIALTHVRTLLDLQRRHWANQERISATLNQAALLPSVQLDDFVLRVHDDHVAVFNPRTEQTLVEVRNVALDDELPVAVNEAYTPFQSYRLHQHDRFSLSLIRRALPPPER